jgi:DNA repair protein RadD
MIPPRGDGRYRKLLAKLEEINKHIGVVGFTATPFRLTSGSLVEGTGRVFDEIVYEVPVLDLVEKGWLCPLVTKGTKTVLEAGGVKVRAGEFVEHDLQNAVDTDDLVEAACDEIARYGEGRRCWLVFSTGVKHAYHISEALEGRGVRSAVIHAKTPNLERKQIVADHKAGRLKCIVNDSVLTKGFDNPLIDLIAVLRPTQSAGLWVQMCGRGMRTLEGKDDCLVLDFGRNTARHGPLDRIKGPAMKDKTIAANLEDDGDLAKECPQCASILPLEERVCPDCGYTWPREERVRKMHEAVADEAPLFSSDISGWLPVSRVTYHEHYKAGSSPTMRVEYHCGLMIYKEWVAFEHQGLPRTKAERWWRERTGSVMATPCPLFSRDAVRWGEEGSLKEPIAIRVRPDGKYWKVVSVRFSEPYVPVPAMQARMAA